MKIQLYGIDQAPASLPIWRTILDDLGNPPVRRVARVLHLSERAVYRYNQMGQAPRPVAMSLFWLTRWGRSHIDALAVNDARVAVGYAECLRRQVLQLQSDLAHVTALGHSGAANQPLIGGPYGR
jgi:predicted DNA-binding transcriptional regulator AlpA